MTSQSTKKPRCRPAAALCEVDLLVVSAGKQQEGAGQPPPTAAEVFRDGLYKKMGLPPPLMPLAVPFF